MLECRLCTMKTRPYDTQRKRGGRAMSKKCRWVLESKEINIKDCADQRSLRGRPEQPLLFLMTEIMDEVELCFPQLINTSCRKPESPHINTMLIYILMSFISLLTSALNLLVIISIAHFRHIILLAWANILILCGLFCRKKSGIRLAHMLVMRSLHTVC